MKIAFLTPEYPHPQTGNSGGIGTSIKNLAKGLLAAGCEVRVLVYGQKSDGVFDDEGVCVQQIKNVKIKGLSWFFTRRKIQQIINTLYRSKQIDVVEVADWTGISSFMSLDCPVVMRLNGSDTYFCHLDERVVKWKNKFHEKRALQNADGLLSVSQFTADTTNAVFGLKKDFTIIPNSIDVTAFTKDQNIQVSSNTILYFGSLIRKKGLLELPFIFNEVIKENPTAQLVLVGKDVPDIISGSGSTWEMMKSLFSEQAMTQVRYLGSVPYTTIQAYINQSTVCVFPSFAEALPVSWIEAMAMEKAIVASNIGWAADVIEDNVNGFLVHPKNHVEYASKINILLSNSQMRTEFGVAARSKVMRKFSIAVVAQQSLAFYQSLIQ
ncbi:glycosyltransferase family 4 protein [Flavobacterium sp. NG2]|uniref:glycosyltransferase family 4 protein n=1 Tax=Flavobacterium sp. NG2 TaxID=3097547 RepID=UPI002A7F2FE7|nr:glycosyltransferase family 4 protein [Flavobacterium sp. NG2]WPR71597.1 glycosyltransferase family 4 protein [Flavobacterium sp. NG2]